MKKTFLNWMTLVLMAFVSVSFLSCGSDNDDSSGGDGTVGSLNGSWVRDDDRYDDGSTEHWTFNNGKFDSYYHYIVKSMNLDYVKGEAGSYTVNAETQTIILTTERWYQKGTGVSEYDYNKSPQTETHIYSVSGNSLTLTKEKNGKPVTYTYTRDTSR
jgi:hypothetical protein